MSKKRLFTKGHSWKIYTTSEEDGRWLTMNYDPSIWSTKDARLLLELYIPRGWIRSTPREYSQSQLGLIRMPIARCNRCLGR